MPWGISAKMPLLITESLVKGIEREIEIPVMTGRR
jgi:hypothetical protein